MVVNEQEPRKRSRALMPWMPHSSLHVGLCCCCALLLPILGAWDPRADAESVLATLKANEAAYSEDLEELVAIPSVSALPRHNSDITAAAQWLQQRLRRAGLENVKVYETQGPHPVVYADWLHAPGKPTVLIYGHYDVQPVDPMEEWHSAPFNVTIRDGFFYGRGVDDDKGGLLMAIQAVEALLAASRAAGKLGSLPVNVKFLLEGQEELLSPDLKAFLQQHRNLLAADLCLSADGRQVSETQGGILLGLRGMTNMQLDVTTAATDMHSGIKGGSVPNANHVLAELLASLRDPASRRIKVEGFYDNVQDAGEEDREDIAKFQFHEDAEMAQLGVSELVGEAGFSALERRWHRPTLEIVGQQGGFTGAGIKTVVPRSAFAKLSCRLVPGQDPGDIFNKVRTHILRAAPSFANVTVTRLGGGSLPWTSPRNTPGNTAAAQVSEMVMGVPPLYHREGATIPVLLLLHEVLGMPATVFGWGLGENIHAPNERLSVSMYGKGREAWARLLLLLGSPASKLVASGHSEL